MPEHIYEAYNEDVLFKDSPHSLFLEALINGQAVLVLRQVCMHIHYSKALLKKKMRLH